MKIGKVLRLLIALTDAQWIYSMTELSWGRFPRPQSQRRTDLTNASGTALKNIQQPYLPRGLGRSYGDSCLISNGTLVFVELLNHFLKIDAVNGVVKVQAGLTIGDLIREMGPRGWFPPVSPGTQFVTIGGAIANDVHGKNYHQKGSFGHNVLELELLRSTGELLVCSRSQNSEMFFATLGGLGLTGIIISATLQLQTVPGPFMEQEVSHFDGVEGYVNLSKESSAWPYSFAWIEMASRDGQIKGIFYRGRHIENADNSSWAPQSGKLKVPMSLPNWVLNGTTISVFNAFYRMGNRPTRVPEKIHFESFFYPLDSLREWNRIYGKRGLLQYQILVPSTAEGMQALRKIFARVAKFRGGSFLISLKSFNHFTSDGMMSFPRPGLTLGMDFPVSGDGLFSMLNECDQLVIEAGGSIYPAKDSRMSKESFAASFPRLNEFRRYLDPAIVSDLWRRLT